MSALISGRVLGVPGKTGQKSIERQLILHGCRDGTVAYVRLHVHAGVCVCRCKLMSGVSLGLCSSRTTNFRFSGRVSHWPGVLQVISVCLSTSPGLLLSAVSALGLQVRDYHTQLLLSLFFLIVLFLLLFFLLVLCCFVHIWSFM